MPHRARPDIFDLHFHLDFLDDMPAFLRGAASMQVGLLAVSCDVPGYEQARAEIERSPAWGQAALGLHPWWTADDKAGEGALEAFSRMARHAPAYGEIGLDFDARHVPSGSFARQEEAFGQICAIVSHACAESDTGKTLSIHAVRAVDRVLDILDETGCLDRCNCVLHWFSGSTPQLERAREAGCWFSFNERQLRTGKGREYSKLVPADRLLLETDLPSRAGQGVCPSHVRASLETALAYLEEYRGEPLREQVASNSMQLLQPSTGTARGQNRPAAH